MNPDPPELPEPRKSGHRLFDLSVSFCALFISALSIFMARETGESMERLVHANSWPFLQATSGNTSDDGARPELAFLVKNAGTGPARVHAFAFTVDDAPVVEANLFINLARACCEAEYEVLAADSQGDVFEAIGTVLTTPVAPGLLAVGEDVVPLHWPRTERNASLWRAIDLARQVGRIRMRACYCSVFDECWTAETGALPVRLDGLCETEATLAPEL